MNKQQNKQIFTIDLKIKKLIVKLIVKEHDQMKDLGKKLFALANIKDKDQTKYYLKLQEELRKIYQKGVITDKVKNKIQQLFQMNNIRIQEGDISKQTETPFRILQDSILMANQMEIKKKRQYKYDYDLLQPKISYNRSEQCLKPQLFEARNLIINYQHKNMIPQHRNYQYETKPVQNYVFQHNYPKLLIQNQAKTYQIPHEYSEPFDNNSYGLQNKDSLTRKYEQLDKRCDQYIIKNIKTKNEVKTQKNQKNHNEQQINQGIHREKNALEHCSLKDQHKNKLHFDYSNQKNHKNQQDYHNIDHKFGQLDLASTLNVKNHIKPPFQEQKINKNKSQNIIPSNNYDQRVLSSKNQNIILHNDLNKHDYNRTLSSYNPTKKENTTCQYKNNLYASPYNMLIDVNQSYRNVSSIDKNDHRGNNIQIKRKMTRKYNYFTEQM